MLSAINLAREKICFENYLIKSGKISTEFINAFINASNRGVEIKILFDDFGSRELVPTDRSRLAHKNISVRYYNPVKLSAWNKNMIRDHRKLLIVDCDVAFVGGAGLADEFAVDGASWKSWRETMIKISGPVIDDWHSLFNQQWQHYTGVVNTPPEQVSSSRGIGSGQAGRVTFSNGIRRQETKRSLIQNIRKSRNHVWLATAYFVPSWRLRRVLRRAARRQVDVRLLLPGTITDHPAVRYVSHRFYGRLLRAGVRIFELRNRMQHQKVAVCDHWVSIGSSNFDRWNLRWNLEANQEILDREFSAQAMDMLKADFAESEEILLDDWLNRPWYDRLLEHWWGWVSWLAIKIGRD